MYHCVEELGMASASHRIITSSLLVALMFTGSLLRRNCGTAKTDETENY